MADVGESRTGHVGRSATTIGVWQQLIRLLPAQKVYIWRGQEEQPSAGRYLHVYGQ